MMVIFHYDCPDVYRMISLPACMTYISHAGFSEDLAFFSVFDGHGGDEVAQHCSDNLHRHFTSLLMSSVNGTVSLPSSPVSVQSAPQIMSTSKSGTLESTSSVQTNNSVLVCDALRSSFRKTDSELAGTEAGEFVGATAVVAVVGKQHIWVAHCGKGRDSLRPGKILCPSYNI